MLVRGTQGDGDVSESRSGCDSEQLTCVYYAPEYHREEGSRTQARAVFAHLAEQPEIARLVLVPAGPSARVNAPVTLGSRLRSGMRALALRMFRAVPLGIRVQPRLWLSDLAYGQLARAIREQHADAAVLRVAINFRFLKRLKRDFPDLTTCVMVHATLFDECLEGCPGESFWRTEEVAQLATASSVMVVADHLRDYLVSRDPSMADRVWVNPNGTDPEVFKPEGDRERAIVRRDLGIPDDAFVVGYVGEMHRWRRIPEIVAEVARARREGLDRLFLVLIGTGEDAAAVRSAIDAEPSLSERVYWADTWVDHTLVPPLMGALDVGLLSYPLPHSCHLKLFEYLACAVPVIGPRGGVPDGTLRNDSGAFLFEEGSGSFAERIRYVYDHEAECRAGALRGRQRIVQEFTWGATASRIAKRLVEDRRERATCADTPE
jgi:glycosyltransferase involved in cell wall biosynthesis